MADKTKEVDLPEAMSFRGTVYPKGKQTVPSDFPTDRLKAITEAKEEQYDATSGTVTEDGAETRTLPSDPPEQTGPGSRPMLSEAELAAMDKDVLVELADKNPTVSVARTDGKDGALRKEDYVAALAGKVALPDDMV